MGYVVLEFRCLSVLGLTASSNPTNGIEHYSRRTPETVVVVPVVGIVPVAIS